MKQAIKTFSSDSEYFFEEGCYILEMFNSADDPDVSIARARVPVGGITRRHRLLGITERYVILQGQGNVEVGSMGSRAVAAGDLVVIPPGCSQRIHNQGEQDLIFLAICSPRFVKDAYEALED